MSTTFLWIGIVVFLAGVAVRYIYKYRYYRDYKDTAHTDLQRRGLKDLYRPKIFIGLVLQLIGCVISIISIW